MKTIIKNCGLLICVLTVILIAKTADTVPGAEGTPVEYMIDVYFNWAGECPWGPYTLTWKGQNDEITIEVPAGAELDATADTRDTDNRMDGGWSAVPQSDQLTNKWDANFNDQDGYEINGKETDIINILPSYAGHIKNIRFKVSDENTICVEKPNGIIGTVHLDVKGATVALSGVNFDDIQNIPLNAKVPESMDGTATADQAKIRAKVTVNGFHNVDYRVELSETSAGDRIDMPSVVTVITDENGVGSEEFVIQGKTKSEQLEDVTIKAQIIFFNEVLCEATQSITVYNINMTLGDIDVCPGTIGHAYAVRWISWCEVNGWAGMQNAADLECVRYAWFSDDPGGAYNSYVKAKLKISQTFQSDGIMGDELYGIYIFDDSNRIGDLNVTINFGVIWIGLPPFPDEQEISAFKGEIAIKGPNTGWKTAPTGQVSAKTSELGFFQHTLIKGVADSPDKISELDHYQVGNSLSRASATLHSSVSAATYATGAQNAGADVKLKDNEIMVITNTIALELTNQSTP
jgi:hypothetical protein